MIAKLESIKAHTAAVTNEDKPNKKMIIWNLNIHQEN